MLTQRYPVKSTTTTRRRASTSANLAQRVTSASRLVFHRLTHVLGVITAQNLTRHLAGQRTSSRVPPVLTTLTSTSTKKLSASIARLENTVSKVLRALPDIVTRVTYVLAVPRYRTQLVLLRLSTMQTQTQAPAQSVTTVPLARATPGCVLLVNTNLTLGSLSALTVTHTTTVARQVSLLFPVAVLMASTVLGRQFSSSPSTIRLVDSVTRATIAHRVRKRIVNPVLTHRLRVSLSATLAHQAITVTLMVARSSPQSARPPTTAPRVP